MLKFKRNIRVVYRDVRSKDSGYYSMCSLGAYDYAMEQATKMECFKGLRYKVFSPLTLSTAWTSHDLCSDRLKLFQSDTEVYIECV